MKELDLSAIRLVGFDVDGVLTDGRIIIHDDGGEAKNFYSRDGHGIKMMIRAGIEVVIITGRQSRVVELRAQELGISELHQKVPDKWPVFDGILKARGLSPAQAAFAGDDVVDLPIMRRVGLAMAPADACPEARAAAHFISSAPGGNGAAREMIEFILKGQGLWDKAMEKYYLND